MTKSSNVWYLLPIICGIFGGIIGWYLLKGTDPHKAKMLVVIGIIVPLIIITTLHFLALPDSSGYF